MSAFFYRLGGAMTWRGLWLVVSLLWGCAPLTLSERLERAEEAATTPEGRAKLGWWRCVNGDAPGALTTFAEAGEHPLAALGRYWLAQGQLKPAEADRALAARVFTELEPQTPLKAQHTMRISFLPALTLRRLTLKWVDGQVEAAGKRWALSDQPPSDTAEALVVSAVALPPGTVAVGVEVEGPVAVFRDGERLYQTPPGRYPAARVRFLAPGQGPLLLAWSAPKPPIVAILKALPPALPLDDELGPDWATRTALATLALADGDFGRVQQLLDGAPPTVTTELLLAQAMALDPGQPSRAVKERGRLAWHNASALAPAQAALEEGRLLIALGRPEEALAALTRVPAEPAHLAAQVSALLALSRLAEAERALHQALTRLGDPCALLKEQETLARQGGPARRLGLADRLAACDQPLKAATVWLEAERPAEALALLTRLGLDASGEGRALKVRALLASGDLQAAKVALGAGRQAEEALLAAELELLEAGREDFGGASPLAQAIARYPTAPESLALMAAEPRLSPFAGLALDTEAAITAYQAEPPLAGPAVRVLDHTTVLFLSGGKSLRRVHEVLALTSREATEVFGELALPDGAVPVAIYNRKADGRRLFVEASPEKDTLSVPDAKPGDFLVAEYLVPGDNGYLYDEGFLTDRFFFRGMDLPVFAQRLEIAAKGRPEVERLTGAPEPTYLPGPWGTTMARFLAERVPLLPPEPASAPVGTWLPWVRLGAGVSLPEALDWARDRALMRSRRTFAFDRWAWAHAGTGNDLARAARLMRATREAVDDEAGILSTDVSLALTTGHGNRALVLSAALRAVGIAHELLLARPRLHEPAGRFLLPGDFPFPLIRLGETYLAPGLERGPLGFLPFPFVGGDALVLWPPEGEASPRPLPLTRAIRDSRQLRLDARWGADGVLRGEVEDRLVGQEAAVVGAYLAKLSGEQQKQVLEQLLVNVVGAAEVVWQDERAQDPDGPLVLRYRFEAKLPGPALALGLFPLGPGQRYAGLATRETPLALDLPTDQTVSLWITSDLPLTVDAAPQVEASFGPHHFHRQVEVDRDSVQIRSHLVVAGGEVSPAVYPDFGDWAREVDELEQVGLKR